MALEFPKASLVGEWWRHVGVIFHELELKQTATWGLDLVSREADAQVVMVMLVVEREERGREQSEVIVEVEVW